MNEIKNNLVETESRKFVLQVSSTFLGFTSSSMEGLDSVKSGQTRHCNTRQRSLENCISGHKVLENSQISIDYFDWIGGSEKSRISLVLKQFKIASECTIVSFQFRDLRSKTTLSKATYRNIALKIDEKSFTIINFALHGGLCLLEFPNQCSNLKL
jgi:hypothetical protein